VVLNADRFTLDLPERQTGKDAVIWVARFSVVQRHCAGAEGSVPFDLGVTRLVHGVTFNGQELSLRPRIDVLPGANGVLTALEEGEAVLTLVLGPPLFEAAWVHAILGGVVTECGSEAGAGSQGALQCFFSLTAADRAVVAGARAGAEGAGPLPAAADDGISVILGPPGSEARGTSIARSEVRLQEVQPDFEFSEEQGEILGDLHGHGNVLKSVAGAGKTQMLFVPALAALESKKPELVIVT
jgi:hypothetical protein